MPYKDKTKAKEHSNARHAWRMKNDPEYVRKKRESAKIFRCSGKRAMIVKRYRATEAYKEIHRQTQSARYHKLKNDPVFKQKRLEARKIYNARDEVRIRTNEQKRKKINSCPTLKMKSRLRTRMYLSLKLGRKLGTTEETIGCGFKTLKLHITSLFKRGMSWENYGNVWHLDHVIPLAAFNLSDPEQLKSAWHFSNLSPELAHYNLSKGDKIVPCQPELKICLQ